MQKKVKIYSTPSCFYCQKAKEFFNKNNINYEEINVSTDEKGREEMINKTHQMGVPVIEIGSEIVIGFDRMVLEDLLDLKK
ncbi:glutathione S-transferase N-terminal domain-containing protein [Patescibacteria group bacterium]|nr:glutathione S-transferase N-terminal domain-containing protein [Patescibacteria group bacterium]